MTYFTKNDMYFQEYSWTVYADDNPKITGAPDNTLLNRKEGYEILYFVNKFAEFLPIPSISQCQKIERMIQLVPSDIRTQAEIFKWIREMWFFYNF